MCLKSCHVQSTDLRSRDFVDLSEDLIANEGCVTYFGDQTAELELDDVVDLLLADVLHEVLLFNIFIRSEYY